MFEVQARKYEVTSDNNVEEISTNRPPPSSTSTAQYFEDDIYGDRCHRHDKSIGSEISRYLAEVTEPRQTEPLAYWKARTVVYPGLANMAMSFLAIPATSSPSEGVFSKTKNILGPQRASLSSMNVEVLLCLKDWYRLFGPLFVFKPKVEGLLSNT